jgi:hypothetical protein
MILFSEGATQAQEDEAKMIIDVLTFAYPGHPWGVRVYDGGFFIRHLAFPANYGMNCKFRDVCHDAAVLKREVIMMAGEWLERAGLARGRYDSDQEITHLEGAAPNHQPDRKLDDVALVMPEIKPDAPAIRDAPRPQALKEP